MTMRPQISRSLSGIGGTSPSAPASQLLAAALIGVMAFAAAPTPAQAKTKIKLATLAPADSAWMKLFDGMNRELKQATGGEVAFKFFAGGAAGDEKDVVRKMRIGQMHGGSMTAVGLGEIAPAVLALQLPLLFKSFGELDYVRNKMKPVLEEMFAKKDFVILGWGDVGYTYIFSNTEVRTLADLKKTKMWAWVDDPVGNKVFDLSGITPVPLSVPDVLPSLQTGLIDAVYTSPLASIALQWNTKVTHVSTMPLAIGIGATLISKETFEKLSDEHKAKLLEVSGKWHKKLVAQIRKDNKKSVKTLTGGGITAVKIGKAERKQWEAVAAKTRKALTGSLFPAALLKEIQGHISDYRAGKR